MALAALAIVAGPAVAGGPDFAAFRVTPYEPRKPAPALSLSGVDGRTVSLADLRGKVVVVFFWTTY